MAALRTDARPRLCVAPGRREPRRACLGIDVPNTLWICDVNGVLVDSGALVERAFAATAARYGFSFGARDFHAVKGLWLLEAYRRLDPGCDPHSRRAFHLGFLRERISEVRAFPGVHSTLAAARAADIRIGAATSHGEIAEACLVQTGLYPFFHCLVTQEEVRRPKPHPDSILAVLSLLGADPRDSGLEAVHVGDTAEDVQAGRAAGIRTIGTTYGMSGEAEIRGAEPDYVIHAFHEMQSWLGATELPSIQPAVLGATERMLTSPADHASDAGL